MCDHYFQYAWRGTDTSGYWIQKCQRCGMEKCVEPEDDYHTAIEYTIVNQTGREHFTELEAERDALRDELAELEARRCETCQKLALRYARRLGQIRTQEGRAEGRDV